MESKPLVVVGAGVSGTAAAIEAARAGVRVTLIDENPIGVSMMGLDVPQFFGKRTMGTLPSKDVMLERVTAANNALAEAEEAGVEVQLGTCVWGAFRNFETSRVLDGPQLGLADDERSWMIKYDRLIVAAGSRDLGMSFPGSNMAGAMGANGAHSLMSRYQALTSRRMVVLGSGNLGLNTARMARDQRCRGSRRRGRVLRGARRRDPHDEAAERGRKALHLPHRQGSRRRGRRDRVRRAGRDRRRLRACCRH